MDNSTHPNSHIVFFRRAPMFSGEARKELEEFYSESHKGIGSYFQKGGMRTATGMTTDIEDLLMPLIINIPKEDRDFRKEVNTFFQNIETKVPAHKTDPKTGVVTGGKAVEIGLLVSNDLPISKDNMPIEVEGWIRYHHGIGHPFVAISEEAGRGNQLKSFFVHDPEAVSAGNIGVNDLRDEALGQYLLLKDKPRSVHMYLTLMGVNVAHLKHGEEAMELRKLADKQPRNFLEVTRDKDKETRFLIEEMINNKILEKVGAGNILLAEKHGGDLIGRNMKESVLYFKDVANSRTVLMLKSLLQEVWKKRSISVETDEDLTTAEPGINLSKKAKAAPASSDDNVPLGEQ